MPEGDTLKKVSPGQPLKIAAATWNEFIDSARKTKRLTVGGAASAGRPTPRFTKEINVQVVSNRTRGGCYAGFIWTPHRVAIDTGAGTEITAQDIGEEGDPVYIVNLSELSRTTHDLTATPVQVTVFPARRAAYSDTDGTPIYEILGYDWKDC